jgi:hypothetical protein
LAITRDGFHRVPLIFSAPFFVVCQAAQTSAVTLALALIPAAAGLTVMKPNLGLALFVRAPAFRTAIVGGALLIGSVVVAPEWPNHWRALLGTTPNYRSAVMVMGGPVALAALLRWRNPEARLLLAMALIPHALFFYDELPLWLIPRTQREAMTLTRWSWVAYGAWLFTSYDATLGTADLRDMAQWLVPCLYIPAAVMVLRHPHERQTEDGRTAMDRAVA